MAVWIKWVPREAVTLGLIPSQVKLNPQKLVLASFLLNVLHKT